MKTLTSPRKCLAFTLVELLVVIAIVAILAALLLPVLSNFKERAGTAKAIHNARMLANAALSYASENRGDMPRTDFTQLPYKRWMTEVIPYVYNPLKTDSSGRLLIDGVFRSPGLNGYRKKGDAEGLALWTEIDWVPVYMAYPEGGGGRVTLNTFKHNIAKTPWIVSSDKNTGSSGLNEGNMGNFQTFLPSSVWVHNNGVVVAYMDGHVAVVPEPTMNKV
ncbi:MAG: type II secretion system protein, partial [Chthoniobacterales bacterium]